MSTIYVKDKDALPKRHQNDYYRTERTLIQAALKGCQTPDVRLYLDPSCGDGRWAEEYRKLNPNVTTTVGVDIDPRWTANPQIEKCDVLIGADFLDPTLTLACLFDLIATNPPYGPKWQGKKKVQEIFSRYDWPWNEGITRVTTAELFARRCLDLLAPNGTLMLLLELQFLASQDRYNGLFSTHPLERVRVCSRRPSFYGGGTNATDFAIFEWRKDEFGKLIGKDREARIEFLYYEREESDDRKPSRRRMSA